MILFLLALIGLVIGGSLVFLPFPTNGVVIFALFVLFLSVVSPVGVILFLLGMTPFRILWLGGGIAPLELLYSLTFLWLLGFSFLKEFLQNPAHRSAVWEMPLSLPIVSMGLVGFWGTVVAIFRGHPFSHWTSDLNFILFFWLYFVMAIHFHGKKEIYKILWPTLWITAGVIVWGVVFRIRTDGIVKGITPGFPRAMAFGSTFFILSLCLFLFSERGSLRRKGFFLLSLFFGLHQFLSFVRVAWIAQIGTVGFLLRVLPISERQRLFKWTGGAFIVLSLVFIFSWITPTENVFLKMPVYLTDRFLSIFTDTAGTGPTMQTRYSEWNAALQKYREHPLTGNGLGTSIQFTRYDYASHPRTTERYIHSSYLYYLLNTGPFGLLVFLWLCWRAVQFGMTLYQKLPMSEEKGLCLGLTASWVFQIFSSIAGNELNNPARTIWAGFFLGALAVLWQQDEAVDREKG